MASALVILGLSIVVVALVALLAFRQNPAKLSEHWGREAQDPKGSRRMGPTERPAGPDAESMDAEELRSHADTTDEDPSG